MQGTHERRHAGHGGRKREGETESTRLISKRISWREVARTGRVSSGLIGGT